MTWKFNLFGWLLGGLNGALEEYATVTELKTLESLDLALAQGHAGPVVFFKHSTTCPISASAYRRVEAYLNEAKDTAPPIFIVKVIESRPVSNAIASQLAVPHESPQVIVVHKGAALWHASHGAITAEAIASSLETVEG